MEYLITSGMNEAPPEASKLSNYIVTSLKTSNLRNGHKKIRKKVPAAQSQTNSLGWHRHPLKVTFLKYDAMGDIL
jgi:hypothetical protein